MSEPIDISEHHMSRKVGTRSASTSILASHATHAATKRLRAMYGDVYAELLAEERESRGLPPVPVKTTMQVLRDRIASLEAELLEKVGPAKDHYA